MSNFKLTTPVAFIIFNRPESTEKVFSEIAIAKPTKLFVIGDGPRTERFGEQEKVAAVREIIKRVDWDCEVITNFSSINLGCKKRVSSGINWLFEQVDEAIILEDDCLPDSTFFRFCQELLEYYRHDQRIGMISGDNFQYDNKRNNHSYYFSKYTHIWGWATWADRWTKTYDVNINNWPGIQTDNSLVDIVGNENEATYWKNIFEAVYNGDIDTWDYQWVLANMSEGRLNIMPAVNMISNIGFNEDATHTTGSSDLANMHRNSIHFPLDHPSGIFRNINADQFTYINFFKISLLKRLRVKFVTWLKLWLNLKEKT